MFAGTVSEAKGLETAEVLLAGNLDVSELAVRAPRLKWIQSMNAGVEKLVPLVPSGVILTNSSGVHAPKGSEYALTALLMLNHRIPHFVTSQRARSWDPAWSTPITGKTVVIIGVGSIGLAAARLARKFGMRVLGISLSGRKRAAIERMYRPENLRTILPQADFVLVTTPLTSRTQNMLGRIELDLLPRHAGLVNLGRAGVIDHEALVDKLNKGELSGAILDVVPEEPLPTHSPLWSTPNLILSPHCAVDDAAIYIPRCLDIFFANLERYIAGKPLVNVVDLTRGY
jgi:phosphoglycerate dehydrogenase-like enzyme